MWPLYVQCIASVDPLLYEKTALYFVTQSAPCSERTARTDCTPTMQAGQAAAGASAKSGTEECSTRNVPVRAQGRAVPTFSATSASCATGMHALFFRWCSSFLAMCKLPRRRLLSQPQQVERRGHHPMTGGVLRQA